MDGSVDIRPARILEWLAAVIGAANCVIVPLLFAQPGGRDFPFPVLYFIEIALLGVAVVLYVALRSAAPGRWSVVPWAAAGIILAFVILGGFSIGYFLIPAFLAFTFVGVVADRQTGGPIARHFGLLLVAAIAQAAFMLLAIQFG